MSFETARSFLSKVAKDEEFRKRLSGCGTRDEQLEFARGAGSNSPGMK